MASEILFASLIFGAYVHFGQCDITCWRDTKNAEEISVIGRQAFVITLPEKNLCLVLGKSYLDSFDEAEKICKKFGNDNVMKSENYQSLKVVINNYRDIPPQMYYVAKAGGDCKIFSKATDPVTVGCDSQAGFACQYQYQNSCAYEIAAFANGDQIKYEMVFSQFSDITGKDCPPETMPSAIPCPDAKIVAWGARGPCTKLCPKAGAHQIKSRSQNVTCGKDSVTVYDNVTCDNDAAECEKDAGTGGPGSNIALIVGLSVGGGVALIVIVGLGIFLCLRYCKGDSAVVDPDASTSRTKKKTDSKKGELSSAGFTLDQLRPKSPKSRVIVPKQKMPKLSEA